MNDNNHISDKELLAFQQDSMDQAEKEQFLEHICSCNYCSEQLATLMAGEMMTAPRDMKANILNATKRPEVQIIMKVKETSARMQLFLYSLKVGTATIGALLLLLLTVNLTDLTAARNNTRDIPKGNEDNISITATIRDNMDIISNSMLDFSNNIMKTEVTKNDQKEK